MPLVKRIFLGDVGTVFEATITENGTAVDISSATAKQIIFERADGSLLTVSAAFKTDGTDGIIVYTTLVGNINILGMWGWRGKVTLSSGGPFSTEQKSFRVNP